MKYPNINKKFIWLLLAVASLVHSDTLYCVWQQITGNSCYSDTNIDNKQKLLSIVTLVTSFKLSELQVVHQNAIQNHRRGCRRVPKFCMGS